MTTPANEKSKPRTVKVPRVKHREFAIAVGERVEGEDKPTLYPLSFSSEEPVRTFSWETWEEYDEILSHKSKDVDLSRAAAGLPLLKSHERAEHFGSVSDIKIDHKEKKLRGMAGFSSIALGQEQETMLREGHLKSVSVGYRITGMELVKKDKDTGVPTYRCSWEPMEVSMTPMPADHTVGFDRARARSGDAGDVELVEFTVQEPDSEGEREMKDPKDKPQEGARENAPGGDQTPSGASPAASPTPATPSIELGARLEDSAIITELGQAHGMIGEVPKWIRAGLSPDQVRLKIFEKMRTQGPGQPPSEALSDMPKKDRQRYSVTRAIRQHVNIAAGVRGASFDGVEAEIHQELSKKQIGEDHGGFIMPWDGRSEEERWAQRTLGTTEATGGSTLVGQQVMPEMIDLLRNQALVLVSGARFYSGLTANLMFDKKTAGPTVYWMGENPASAVTGSEPTYGYVTMSPKTLMGSVQVPRQLIVQSSLDVEADIRNDLAIGHGLALDLAALHGTGTDKEPVGIYHAADVQSHAVGGVPDLTDVTTMPSLLAAQNADLGTLAWLTTPTLAGVLKRTALVSGYPLFIWDGTFRAGNIVGWTARATNQCSATLGSGSDEHAFVFANWRDMAIGMWGPGLEIVVDIYTKATYGQIVITSYSMGDVGILRPVSFVKGTGAKTS